MKKSGGVVIDIIYNFNKFERMKSNARASLEIIGIAIRYAAVNSPEMSINTSPTQGFPSSVIMPKSCLSKVAKFTPQCKYLFKMRLLNMSDTVFIANNRVHMDKLHIGTG
jgi:hypothetical protein